MNRLLLLSLYSSTLFLGCTHESSIGITDGVVSGIVENPDPGASGELRALWLVTSGSADHVYLAGSGAFDEGGFDFELPTPVPSDALNAYGDSRLGVGFIAAWPSGGAPGQPARLSDEAELQDAIGAASNHAIVYREGSAPFEGTLSWVNEFPEGFSCGRGVPAASDDDFDTFEPVACDQVELRMGDVESFEFPDWT